MLGRVTADWEVQELLARSGGPNLGMDFLPGAIGFDPVAHRVDPDEAAKKWVQDNGFDKPIPEK